MLGFPKIRGTLLGVPVIRTRVFGGLYCGPPFWETTMYGLGFRAYSLGLCNMESQGDKWAAIALNVQAGPNPVPKP